MLPKATSGGIILFTLLMSACNRAEPSRPVVSETAPPAVAVAKAGSSDMSRQVSLTAEFRPFQEVEVMAKVAGYVKSIGVDVGDRVRQGQVLAILEIPEMADDLARGKAAADRSQAQIALQQDEVRRAESGYQTAHLAFTRLADVAGQKPGLVARQEVDDAQGKDLVAEAQVSAAKSALTAAREEARVTAAELKRTETMIDYTRVVAPFDGVITRRYADTGTMLQAGTASSTQAMPLVRVSENALLRLILPVPESAVPSVREGQAVEVRVPTLNRSFPGRVARFTQKVSPATRTMDTEVDVPNPSLVLVPGMYAEVNLVLEHRPNALTVPLQAVDIASDEASGQIMVVTQQNTLFPRTVQLGLQNAGSVEVRSGLNDGDLVVVGSRTALKQGERITPKLISRGPG
jgi:RND family efflux transporter MFP subunit